MIMKRLTSFPRSIVAQTASHYNKSFHAKVFTLFASSESEVHTFAHFSRVHYAYCYAFMRRDEGQWFLDPNGIRRVRRWIVTGARHGMRHVLTMYRRWMVDWNSYTGRSRSLLSQDLRPLNDHDLLSEFSDYYYAYLKAGSVAYLADSFMSTGTHDWLEDMLRGALTGKRINGDAVEMVRLLTMPTHLSFALKEEKDLYAMARIFDRRFKRQLPSYETVQRSFPDLSSRLRRHERSYYWVKNNYYNIEYLGGKKIYERLRRLIVSARRQRRSLDEEYRSRSSHVHRFRRDRRRLLNTLPLSRYYKNILEIARLFAKWKDVRKSGVYIGMHHFHRFLTEIGRRRGMSAYQLSHLVFYEIKELYNRPEVMLRLVRERQNGAFFALTPKGFYITGARAAKPFFKYFMTGKSTSSTMVQGVAASPGVVRGKARIVLTTRQMTLFRRGEILIANQTTPEFVPIMKKANAIVTEQGGVTSHAAIVARELKKPCIIGTKIATKVLKDGDRVEVDATKGIVTKI